MKDARKAKPVTRLEPHRLKQVRPTYQLSKAELEEPITLPQMLLEEAARSSRNRSRFSTSTSPDARARPDVLGHHP